MIKRKIKLLGLIVLLMIPLKTKANDCMTTDCHTGIKNLQKLHFPAEDDCTRCHRKRGPKQEHKFSLTNQTDVCFDCHDENRNRKHVHDAISSADCVSCHNGHGGEYSAYLKVGQVNTLCFECHDKETMIKKVVHTPIKTSKCTACHRPHSSDYAKLLISKAEGFCLRCHKDKDFSKGKMNVHSIMEDGCTGCHNPHSSDYPNQLAAAPGSICGKCHEDMVEKAKTASYKHAILEKDKKCLSCHDPHASSVEYTLKKEKPALCLECHRRISGADRRIYNIHRVMKMNPFKHEPVEEGDCSMCHDPHGSNFVSILRAKYPPRFYSEFAVDNYQICFQCHNSSLATIRTTDRATNFRDGTRNLHYLHVNQKKGRTCRACHEVHAAEHEKIIREETPFGKWQLPIVFKKTPTGGNCTPGCHKPFSYDRVLNY